ncbi:50S ribosomal protein L24 [Candidatus Jorgensenbacteria bacterium RIFCSPLOWO2_02_FULL_45_12]|uniref:Large ribosomal subunit protein uL24 n=2 Tax=Candidatus Joergenseniibacteriota TaxID=1752739 RepID=A0A1F6BQ02_9BACT|nr:MAG: 50S ribosomal protein L24 [Candidatus Jorgensenbacteria bacterium GW2011_GWA2_45_9]OGG38948.1 MAG: 50S ribosomal protein L24 [Candidatus Jorgensenbacteria bacterium RIFCSPHIGHO2_02_FULL_45_20]OGG42707.1 MAG: 50S ribosomal protein L24 [Candidatus Jorgensenbacteria bacterium RIFCSPLOWO2_02_FULL_45_12]
MKKGDTVKIISGKDRGKTGKILRFDTRAGKITVEGVNVYKKHSKPKRQGEKGEVVSIIRPFDVSNAMVVCSSCNRAVREQYRIEDGKKTRCCRKCGAAI